MTRNILIRMISVLILIPTLGACGSFNERQRAEPGPAYPNTIDRGEIYDIQVFRDVTKLTFTNTTTTDFGPSRIWLNKRYSFPLDSGFTSGQTLELNLERFVDEFGDTYRAGGFFASRIPAAVVLAELEAPGPEGPIMHGLIVVENRYD